MGTSWCVKLVAPSRVDLHSIHAAIQAQLDRIVTREVTLAELPAVFDAMLAGDSFGRTVVKL